MKSYDEVVRIHEPLEAKYLDRHDAHRKLRDFWHGRYWDKAERDSGGVSSIFRDLTARQSEVGPDIKLVYNVLKDVCVKFQSFLAPLPMIRMYVDPPGTATRKNQATLKERYLYGMWAANNMNKTMSDKGWYLPLMGDCMLGIYPDIKANTCRTILRSPEYAYPLQSYDGSGTDGFVFKWETTQSAVMREFPDWTPPADRQGRFGFNRRRPSSDPAVEILEFSDKMSFVRYVGGQKVLGVDHNFGFDLFDHVKFINVPDEVWGHGAVEQAVNLVEMGNAYLSLMMQSAIENVFPTMVLEDPQKAPEEIEKGAGAVIPVNAGGKVYYLTPPSGNLLANAQWGQEIERMIKSDTSMPDVNFGNFPGSVATGKAINELQGAGTGSLVEMVQGIGIGAALVNWNEKALHIGRTMFKDEKLHLFGREAGSLAEINPRHFAMSIRGSQLVGSTRNEVVFMPHLDMHSKVVMGLQLAGAGLVSKAWQRDQVGIPDSTAMDEEIVTEAIQEGVLAALLQAIVDPAEAEDTGTQAANFLESGSPPVLSHTGPSMPGEGPVQGAPQGPGTMPAPGPTGEPPPEPAPEAVTPGATSQGVPLDAAISSINNVQGITGRVFLIGEIVTEGVSSDAVEIAVTREADRDPISQQVGFPTSFSVVTDEPKEQFVEVTPGSSAVTGGEAPTIDMLGE